jgi:hypothetical protein
MPADEVVATLRQAWAILEELQVPAALMGGPALAHWGHVRTTQDVDLLIALSGVRVHSLLSALSAAGFRSKGRHPLIRLEDVEFLQLLYQPPDTVLEIQIDLLLADTPFHRQAVERRVTLPVSALGFQLDVVSCEDLIVLKLLAWRILDRADVAELVTLNRTKLDFGHLLAWVRAHKLEQRFAQAWGDAFPGEPAPFPGV